MKGAKNDIVRQLQEKILAMQGFASAAQTIGGSLGIGPLESAFPNSTFPLGVIHEFLCSSNEQAAASEGFIAGLLSRFIQQGSVCIWISRSGKLFPSSLNQFCIEPDKVVFISLQTNREILWAMEEALKCEGLAAVIAELPEIDFAQSRRLQLATEKSRVTGFVLRNAIAKKGATACTARWQVSHLPSEPGDLPGVGYPRWQVDLLKVRNGQPGSFQIEWLEDRFMPVITKEYFIRDMERAV